MNIKTDHEKLEDVRVTLEDIGEGRCGEYQEDDQEDIPLLRVYVEVYDGDEWLPVEDGSFCTAGLTTDMTKAERDKACALLHIVIAPEVVAGRSIKKLCERLSWIIKEDVEAGTLSQQLITGKKAP